MKSLKWALASLCISLSANSLIAQSITQPEFGANRMISYNEPKPTASAAPLPTQAPGTASVSDVATGPTPAPLPQLPTSVTVPTPATVPNTDATAPTPAKASTTSNCTGAACAAPAGNSPSCTSCGNGCTANRCGTSVGCGNQCGCGNSCGCSNGCGCNNGCCDDGCGLFGCCDLSEPWKLSDHLFPCHDFKIGGWTQVGYHDNNIPLSQSDNDLLSFEDFEDRVNLNQQWFYIEKVAKSDGCCGAWGYRADVVYGVDAQKTQAFGNPNAGIRGEGSWDASLDHGAYGWAIPQAYLQYAVGDWDVIAGHFFTPIGYEVIPSTGNFFYSHSLTMFNSEPFTHTGVLSKYKGIEGYTIYGGWSAGWDTGFEQLNGGSNFIGGVGRQLTEDTSITYLCTAGNFGWRNGPGAGQNNSYSHSIVLQTKVSDRIDYVFQSDLVDTNNDPVSTYHTIGINQYLFYKINDCWKAGTRVEWWKADGISFYEATAGLNYKYNANLTFRPEFRKDWSPGIGLDEETFSVDAVLAY